jgi:amino acid transporter
LKTHVLNFWEVLAQSIALISPTMTAALIVPLMFATAGNAGWFAYALGAVMLLFVALNLNQFARRSAMTGSMFNYSIAGLGPTGGSLAGWSLIWAYTFIGTAGMTGFTTFAQQLLQMAGLNIPPAPLLAICVFLCWVCAYKDVRLSAILTLGLEAISVALILVLIGVALGVHGFAPDVPQLTLSGASLSTIALGVIVAIFSQVGFEAATAFGQEAKNPLKTIPRAVIVSLVVTGLFFVIVTYTETMWLANAKPTLDKQTAPLTTLATMLHMGYFAAPIALGAMVSFFSLALSCMNSGARIMWSMGKHGAMHDVFSSSHPENETPHAAITVMAALEFIIPSMMVLGGMAVTDAFNDAGTFGAIGFSVAYIFISVAAPAYLKKLGELKLMDMVIAVAAVVLLTGTIIFGFFIPPPAPPVNYFPYIFIAYFLIGFVCFARSKNKPNVETMLSTPLVPPPGVMHEVA